MRQRRNPSARTLKTARPPADTSGFLFWCDRCGKPFRASYLAELCAPCAVARARHDYTTLPPAVTP